MINYVINCYDNGKSTGDLRKIFSDKILGSSDVRKLHQLQYDYFKKDKKSNFFFWTPSLKKDVICTFCLAKCITKGQKKCSFWHEEWLSPQKEHFFCSFSNFIFLERRSLVLFALPNASKKDKIVFLLTTWRMALATKRAFFLFLSERHF